MTRNQLVKQLADIATQPIGNSALAETAPRAVGALSIVAAPTELFIWFEDTAARALGTMTTHRNFGRLGRADIAHDCDSLAATLSFAPASRLPLPVRLAPSRLAPPSLPPAPAMRVA